MKAYCVDNINLFNILYPKFVKSCQIKNNLYFMGLDCEYICKANTPESFEKSKTWTLQQTYNISICTLQIASKEMALFIDIKKFGKILDQRLKNILESEQWIKVGVGLNSDIRYLVDNYKLGQCMSVYDLGVLSRAKSEDSLSSLDFLCKKYDLGKKTNANSIYFDWGKDNIDPKMTIYGLQDAILSEKLGRKIILDEDVVNDNDFSIQFMDGRETEIVQNEEKNPISFINEFAQINVCKPPKYTWEELDNKMFICTCTFEKNKTYGTSKSKKEAKTMAATEMKKLF